MNADEIWNMKIWNNLWKLSEIWPACGVISSETRQASSLRQDLERLLAFQWMAQPFKMLFQTNYSSLHTALHHAIMSEEIFFHLHKFAWNSHIYLSIHYRIWTLNYPQLFSGYVDVCVYGIDGDCGAIKILQCGWKTHVLCSYVTKSIVWLLKENWLLRRYLQDSFSLWTYSEGD